MFKEMRRKQNKLEELKTIELLKSCEYGILSTVGENGYSYGVPLNYVYINKSIYFNCALEGHKLDNIKNNNKVSFCVVGDTCVLPEKFDTKFKSAIIFGIANEVFEDEKNAALLELINKYSPDYMEEGKKYIEKSSRAAKVIKISIEHITGKAEI